MSDSPRCPRCGTLRSEDAPAGLCPKCLVQAGFESEVEPQPVASGSGTAFEATRKSPVSSSAGFEPPPVEELIPLFPQLEILELLGKGGMGAVYKARQRGLVRFVALKILPQEIGHDLAFAERFGREARALARLSHNHIVSVYDFGQVDNLFYVIMEYVDGVNLRQTIQAGGLTPQAALAIVPQICEALQFAHDEGIVHRDIKPENILVDKKGHVKIADFGLAKMLEHDPSDDFLTATRQIMGTPRYMAPEQMQSSRDVDHRSDIYSLGVVLYELLTGELPIGKFALPSRKVQVDVRLDEIVLRALEQEPEQRYQHASDVKLDLERVMSGRPFEHRGSDPGSSTATPPSAQPLHQSDVQCPARFSRKAIWGACWAPLFFVCILGMTTSSEVRTSRPAYHDAPVGYVSDTEELPAPSKELTEKNRPSEPSTSGNLLPILLLVTLLPLGLSAPIGTTVLGSVAISNIRNSQGRLCGLPLALADALFFPLLVLDGVIFACYYFTISAINSSYPTDNTQRVLLASMALTLLSAGLVDLVIVILAWRIVRK